MGIRGNGMSKGRTFCQKVKKQRVRSLSPRDLSFMRGGGEWLVQMEEGRVITFNATKNGRITKNLSLVWGGSEGFGTHEG